MKPYNTSERLKQIMTIRHIKQAEILELAKPYCRQLNIKMGKSALSQYVSGKTEPGQAKLSILGLALNVSEAWLMGYDVPMERSYSSSFTNCPTHVSEIANKEDCALLDRFHALNPEGRKKLIDHADDLVASGKYCLSPSAANLTPLAARGGGLSHIPTNAAEQLVEEMAESDTEF